MIKLVLLAVMIVFAINPGSVKAADSCLDEAELKRIDAQFEQSLVTVDHVWLSSLLSEEFLWIHNQVSSVDTKDSLIGRMRSPGRQSANKSRVVAEVAVRRAGNAAVITGHTRVERTEEYVKRTGSAPTPTYHFMRTYVLVDGRCLLLGNHTYRMQNSEE